MHGKYVIVLSQSGVSIKSPNGVDAASISAILTEGEPIGMDVNSNFLTVFTMEGFLKLYNLEDVANLKLVTPVRNLYDMCSNFGEVIQAKSNSNGSKIALTLAGENLVPDGKLYVWDIEPDKMSEYDFLRGNGSVEDESDSDDTKALYERVCRNCIPLSIFWDRQDPRLLVVDAKKLSVSKKQARKGFRRQESGIKDSNGM